MRPSGFHILAYCCCSVASLIRLDECRAHIPIALFGHAKPVRRTAGGIRPTVHAEPGHQVPRVRKAGAIPDCCAHGEGKETRNPFVIGQSLTRLLVARGCGKRVKLLAILG